MKKKLVIFGILIVSCIHSLGGSPKSVNMSVYQPDSRIEVKIKAIDGTHFKTLESAKLARLKVSIRNLTDERIMIDVFPLKGNAFLYIASEYHSYSPGYSARSFLPYGGAFENFCVGFIEPNAVVSTNLMVGSLIDGYFEPKGRLIIDLVYVYETLQHYPNELAIPEGRRNISNQIKISIGKSGE